MTDITLGDLAPESEAADTSGNESNEDPDSGGDSDTGKYIVEIYEKLEDRGLIEPILFGPDSGLQEREREPDDDRDGEAGEELNAETIADAGKTVIDTMGDVRISELVKFCESNPEQVNQLIEQQL